MKNMDIGQKMYDKQYDRNFVVPYSLKGSIYDEQDLKVIQDLLLQDNSTLSCGKQRELFEQEFASYIGAKYTLSLTSCTIALEFATYLLNLQPDDHIIATPFTYQASVQHLLTKRLKVSFCDIDRNNLFADINSIQKLITNKTKAIYVTHYGGLMGDMDALMQLARKHNIVVIEDCAHAIGSEYKGRKAGVTADISCFSFHSSKNMSTLGEGGMISFNNSKWFESIKNIRGNEPDAIFKKTSNKFGSFSMPNIPIEMHYKNSYEADCINLMHSGTNSTLSEPAAAVGRSQLLKVEQFNNKRREIGHYLNNALSEIEEIRIQQTPPGYIHTYHLYSFFVRPEHKIDHNEFIDYLYQHRIEIIQRYFPLHLFPEWRYRGSEYGQCPNVEQIWFKELVNLPCYPALNEYQLQFMIKTIKDGIQKCSQKSRVFYS